MDFGEQIRLGIPQKIPDMPVDDPKVPRAPARPLALFPGEIQLALANALRYFPREMHEALAPEFLQELRMRGRIYMYRFRPQYEMKGRPIFSYPARCQEAAAMMMMIQNNLDPAVAQFSYELVTYGGTGTVFQNWAQYLLTMKFLSEMEADQTLVMSSGHPVGLFPSSREAPRVVISNGMMIPAYSTLGEYTRLAALGVTMYGQMTAGSWMYIGSQGIVHGTVLTVLNAARKFLGLKTYDDFTGKVFVSSGLGGMSGAQGKATQILRGLIGVFAEIDPAAAEKRMWQGWIDDIYPTLDAVVCAIRRALSKRKGAAICYLGNIVDLWERLVAEDIHVDLGSDQTSLHNPYEGGYYPVGLSLEEAKALMFRNNDLFREKVHASLVRQAAAIRSMVARGMYFFDYGNAFLVSAKEAGADIVREDGSFIWPSYVQDIMGPEVFDREFGPYRWVCTSGLETDLAETDKIALGVLRDLAASAPVDIQQQLEDNIIWVENADRHKLVIGTQARILYSNAEGRIRLALAFNEAVRTGRLKAPVVIGRDHHDVSGTDSPFRETANVYDGSNRTADMAVQNVIGDAIRGATWVSLHNGGGVGWGKVVNGGFGLLLDGSERIDGVIQNMLLWDVMNGIARRAWAGNANAIASLQRAVSKHSRLKVTERHEADLALLARVCQ